MWRCDQCDAEAEDHFEVCWRCGAPRAGAGEGADAGEAAGSAEAPEPPPNPKAKTCPACGGKLAFRGVIPLRTHGPQGWSLFRELKELGEKLWPVRVWACRSCKRLELYEGR